TGKQTLSAASHTVGETAGTASSLSNYTSAIVCKDQGGTDRKSTRLNSSHLVSSYAAACVKVVCTITNTRIPATGQLEVRKALSPTTYPCHCNLHIHELTSFPTRRSSDLTGKQTLSAASHTVGETAGTASSLSNYTSAIVCKDQGG